jgi:hypothetical protein
MLSINGTFITEKTNELILFKTTHH